MKPISMPTLLFIVCALSVIIYSAESYTFSDEFTTSPENITVYEHETVELECAISTDLNRTLYWIIGDRFRNASQLISKEGEIKKDNDKYNVSDTDVGANRIYTLFIHDAGMADEDFYACATPVIVDVRDGKEIKEWMMTKAAYLTVTQHQIPAFACSTTPEKPKLGESVNFTCSFNKTPELSLPVNWGQHCMESINDTNITTQLGRRIFPRENLTAMFTLQETCNYEKFTCYVDQKHVCDVTPLQLDHSPIVVKQRKPNGRASFSCEVTIEFPPITKYSWSIFSNDLGNLTMNSSTEIFQLEDNGKTLTISNLTELSSNLEIRCHVTNMIGLSEVSPVLLVVINNNISSHVQSRIILIVISCSSILLLLLIISIAGCAYQKKCKKVNDADRREKQSPENSLAEFKLKGSLKLTQKTNHYDTIPEKATPIVTAELESKVVEPEAKVVCERPVSEVKYATPVDVGITSQDQSTTQYNVPKTTDSQQESEYISMGTLDSKRVSEVKYAEPEQPSGIASSPARTFGSARYVNTPRNISLL